MLYVLLIVLLVMALLGGPYTGFHSYGWAPSGALGILLVVLLVMLLVGRL